MPLEKLDDGLTDFSAGELDADIKRSLSPLIKTGGRQALNWRILNTHKKANRPGRTALFPATGRVEGINMPGGAVFFLNFGSGFIKVFNAAGANVFSATTMNLVSGDAGFPIPWTARSPVLAQIGKSIYIAYPEGAPSNVPQILSFDGVATWALAPYAETVTPGGQKRTAFYRISPQNITMQPSGTSGVVNIVFSQDVLSPGMVGTFLRFCDRQLQILTVVDAQNGTATVVEPLPPGETLTPTGAGITGSINVGDVVIGSITGAQGIVVSNGASQHVTFVSGSHFIVAATVGQVITQGGTTGLVTAVNKFLDSQPPPTWYYTLVVSITSAPGTAFVKNVPLTSPLGTFTPNSVNNVGPPGLVVQLIANSVNTIIQFSGSEVVTGPNGFMTLSSHAITIPQAVAVWDDEVMNLFRGYPSSLFADQSRLGFANFPSVPSGIAWSALGLPNDLFVGAQPDDAIFELVPDNSTIFYVMAGMESSEFIFCDKAIYYIPINQNNPLKPGSVAFNKLADYGIAPNVSPRRAEQTIIYIKAGATAVGAVQAPGAYYRPYVIDDISDMHSHLFLASLPVSIAIPSGPRQFEEQYIYIGLLNGTAVIGRYNLRNGLIEPGPEGKPSIGWLPWNGAGIITWISGRQSDVVFTTVYPPNNVSIAEELDNTQYLDGALLVNNLPAPFAPPGGKGPLFNFPGPNSTVTLIDQGRQFMGTYSVDGNGFIVPQFFGGENLSSAQLVAGQPWTAIFEPFMPHAPPGPDRGQRMRRRKVAKGLVSVQNSTGFVFGTRRVPAYFVDDDATQPAPLREASYRIRPRGRKYDPRLVLTKDTPGPLTVVEYGFEVTV